MDSRSTGRVSWVIAGWAILAIAAVAWLLPRGREATGSPPPVETTVSASALVRRGYDAMERRDTDPGALDRALNDFTRAYEADPESPEASFALAWARQLKGLPESEWRPLYQAAAAEASLLAYLSLYNLAWGEKQKGDDGAAAALLERAVRILPDRADGWRELARARNSLGQVDAAAEAERRAAELQP